MNQYFKDVICLSLKSRPDRRERVTDVLGDAGIKFEFFDATNGGVTGFCKSMYNIFQKFDGPLFVFEDDVEFIADSKLIDCAIDELPEDWDLFYLGANCREHLKKHSTHLQVLKNAWCTHAVGYSEKMVTYIRQHWDGEYKSPFIFDEWLRQKIQPYFKCFISDPMICTQVNNYSDIWKKETNYNIIKQSQRFYENIS